MLLLLLAPEKCANLLYKNVLLSYGSCGWRAPVFLHFMVQLDLDLPSSSALSCFAKVIGLTTVDALDSMTHSHASGNKSAKVLLLSLLCLFQSILKAFSYPLGRARGLKVRWKKSEWQVKEMVNEKECVFTLMCLSCDTFWHKHVLMYIMCSYLCPFRNLAGVCLHVTACFYMCACKGSVGLQPSDSLWEFLTSFPVLLTHYSHSHRQQASGHTEEIVVRILMMLAHWYFTFPEKSQLFTHLS